MSQSWKEVWRKGIGPLLNRKELEALRDALVNDDPRLIQGATTTPPPLQYVQDWPTEAACALGYCGWQGDGLTLVKDVEEFFARKCWETDQALGEPAAIRWFLNTYDDWPRDEMRREMIIEVQRSLALLDAPEESVA